MRFVFRLFPFLIFCHFLMGFQGKDLSLSTPPAPWLMRSAHNPHSTTKYGVFKITDVTIRKMVLANFHYISSPAKTKHRKCFALHRFHLTLTATLQVGLDPELLPPPAKACLAKAHQLSTGKGFSQMHMGIFTHTGRVSALHTCHRKRKLITVKQCCAAKT